MSKVNLIGIGLFTGIALLAMIYINHSGASIDLTVKEIHLSVETAGQGN